MSNASIAVLSDPESGSTAEVLVSQGFNCFRWSAAPGQLLYAPDGFESGESRPSSGGCPLLFPFPGRIHQGRFTFQGKQYMLPEGDGKGNALHGFVFNRPWRLVDSGAGFVMGEFQGSVDAPETLDLWPSDYRIQATYRLGANQLVCEVRYENPGPGDLPCGFGTHAYFRLPIDPQAKVEDTVLTVPVKAEWIAEQLIATGEQASNDASRGLAAGLRLGDWQFDSQFALADEASGMVETSVASGPWRLVQQCGEEFGCYVIYTPGHRQAVCIEPYTNVPAPFKLEGQGIPTGLTVLKPGESRSHTLVLSIGPA